MHATSADPDSFVASSMFPRFAIGNQDVASYEETQKTMALLKILALGNSRSSKAK